jgi:hypothetical protein
MSDVRRNSRVQAAGLRSTRADPARKAQFFDRLEAGTAARLAKAPSRMKILLARIAGEGRVDRDLGGLSARHEQQIAWPHPVHKAAVAAANAIAWIPQATR